MRNLASLALALLLSAFALASHAGEAPVIGAYYPGWSAERYPVAQIPADKLTHLFYAFARIEHGACAVAPGAAANFVALAELKRKHPTLRTLISIGGWEADGFSDAALTSESREHFVASCMALFFDPKLEAFDGVDIDWEFPVSGGPPKLAARPQDRHNMTLLAREFRRQLDALGKARGQAFLLTAALPAGRLQSAGAFDPARSFELARLAQTLDFINLMSYDMGTGFSKVATFNAPLREDKADPLDPKLRHWNNVEGAIAYYRQHGVPAQKLVLGVPFYGRGFRVTSDANHGLYQPYSGPFEAGDWRDIKARLLTNPAWQQHWHPVAQAPWLFNPAEHIFVSYEDPRSIGLRAKLAKDAGLRGVFMWELTGDDDQHSLLRAMADNGPAHNGLRHIDVRENGLVGVLVVPDTARAYPGVLRLGGAEGGVSTTDADTIAAGGYAVLALAYFGADGLPPDLEEVPLEYFGKAIAWMKKSQYIDSTRLGIVGISRGSTLALLLPTIYKNDFDAVVALAPSHVVWQSTYLDWNRYAEKSSFSFHGKALPFVPYDFSDKAASAACNKAGACAAMYEFSLGQADRVKESLIPVEQIAAPILLISGKADTLWPSTKMADQVIRRLADTSHPYEYRHLAYDNAGHCGMNDCFGGGTAEGNQVARNNLGARVMEFLDRHLKQARNRK